MLPLATAAQMRELDRVAIEERGIPSLKLMEQAAQAVADAVRELVSPNPYGPAAASFTSVVFLTTKGQEPTDEEQREMDELRAIAESKNTDPTPRVAVFCGPGNNGGDGIAAARLLMGMGYQVRAFLVGDRKKMTRDANVMETRLQAVGGRLESFSVDPQALDFNTQKQLAWLSTCDCVVDAIFGVGLSRPVEGNFLTAIQMINQRHCPVVACDIPSGVHTDTGEILGEAVKAHITVTFTCAKPGLYLGEGSACAGEVRVVDIGVPDDLVHANIYRASGAVHAMEGNYPLPRRPLTAHKGDFGKVFVLAGSVGYTGAPVLAANAAVRSGAGLVFLGVPKDIYPIAAVKCDEAMPFPLPDDYDTILNRAKTCDVALIGPGLGRAVEAEELVLKLLADLDIPVVLDADGINALSAHINILDKRSALTVLTPHGGEFQRLSGCQLPIGDRLSAARNFARAHNCVLVLKGHNTVTAAPDGRAFINTAGNPGMAKGGSGDVLAGILAGLLAQKHLVGHHTDLTELVACGVYYHGQAGDRCAAELGEYGMTPSDMLAALPQILKEQTTLDPKTWKRRN